MTEALSIDSVLATLHRVNAILGLDIQLDEDDAFALAWGRDLVLHGQWLAALEAIEIHGVLGQVSTSRGAEQIGYLNGYPELLSGGRVALQPVSDGSALDVLFMRTLAGTTLTDPEAFAQALESCIERIGYLHAHFMELGNSR